MKRTERERLRLLLWLMGAAAFPGVAVAQAPGPLARVGVMWAGTTAGSAHLMRALVLGMKEAGFVQGENLAVQTIYAEGQPARLKPFATELVRTKVHVIFAAGNDAVEAAMQAAPSTPIVFALTGDPVQLGFVKSLNRPGGNLTGTTLMIFDVMGKRVQIVREALPRAARLGVLYRAEEPTTPTVVPLVEQTAKQLGMEIVKAAASQARDLEAAFAQLAASRAEAVVVVDNPTFHGFRQAIVETALKHRLPTMHGNPEYSDLGGLLFYGTDLAESCRQAARLVAKILRGSKPADTPVEQPTKFNFVVNLKTARALGLTIPQSILLRADRVIE